MANMFDYLDDPDKKKKSFTSVKSGNMFDYLDKVDTLPLETRFSQPNTAPIPSAVTPSLPQMIPSHVSTMPSTTPQPSSLLDTLSNLGKGFWEGGIRSAAEPYKQDGLNMLYAAQQEALAREKRLGITPSNTGASFLNPSASSADLKNQYDALQSKVPYQPTDLAGKIGDFAGGVAGSAPAFALGGAATEKIAQGLLEKLAPKIAPSALPYAERAIKDSLSFAPVGLMDSNKLSEVPGNVATNALTGAVLGPAFHGVGESLRLGKDVINNGGSLKQALAERKLSYPELPRNPIMDEQKQYQQPVSLRDAKQRQYENTFADTSNPMRTEPLQSPGRVLSNQGLTDAELLQQKQLNAQNAFGRPINAYNLKQTITPAQRAYIAKQAELSNTFKDLPIGSVDIPLARKTLQESIDTNLGINKPTRSYEGLDAFGKPIKAKKYGFTTGEQRAFQELQDGIAEAQNYTRHTDVLAPYPPGTTVEQAYADVKKNTGIDLPKLMDNWNKTQSLKNQMTPEELRMGRISGVVPNLRPRDIPIRNIGKTDISNTSDMLPVESVRRLGLSGSLPVEVTPKVKARPKVKLKPRDITPTTPIVETTPIQRVLPKKPERLIWTNKDQIGPATRPPMRSITEANMDQLPGRIPHRSQMPDKLPEIAKVGDSESIPRMSVKPGQRAKESDIPVPDPKFNASVHPIAEKFISQLDEIEAAARARIAANKNRLNAGLPIDTLIDYSVIGAVKISKKIIKFSVWSEDMVKDLGDDIKPHLREIWNKSKEFHSQMVDGTFIRPESTGNADTFRSKVDRSKVKGKSLSERTKGLRTQFIDDIAPLENLEKSVNGKVASAENSLYKQGRLFRGSSERADEMIQSKLAPILKEVEKSGKTIEDLGDYALAVHAKDVNEKLINSGFTNAEINDTIAKYGTPEMETARKKLLAISNESLKSLARSGIIDDSLVTMLNKKWPNYMPLFRSFEDEKIEFASGLSKSLTNVTAPIERLKGSDRKVIDPMESMVKNIYRTVSAVDRNKVASQLSKLADNDENSLFIRRLGEGEERSRLNTVYAMEGGQKVHYEVQPDVYRALTNLDKESSNLLIKLLQKPAGLLRAGATLTPEFSLRNPIRDIPHAYAVSKSGLNPVIDVPRALWDVIGSKRGKETPFNDFLRDNGGFGNIVSMDRKVHQEVVRDILSQPASKNFVNVISGKSLIKVLRSIADISESAAKLAEYKAALRSGVSRDEAAYRARDIMDFARAGSSVREVNKIVSFLNANIQGKAKLYRAIKEDPVGVTTRAFVSVTLPTIGAYLAQKYLANDVQKERIADAPDWMTSTFWLIPIPGTDQIARIPKPFDLAPIFANLPERILKYIETNDPESFDGFAKQTLASAAIPTMITGLIPFLEGVTNYSLFKLAPIIPQREADLNYPDQYDIYTTGTAKLTAELIDKLTGGKGALKNFGSPRVIDNTIQGLTAGLGAYATSAIDFVAETSGLVDKKQKPERSISELPLLRAFLVSEKSGGKSMDKLYNEKDKLLRDKGSSEANEKPFDQVDRLEQLNSATTDIGNITKEIRQIENNPDIDPRTKRMQINELSKMRNEIAKQVMGN